MATTVAAWGIFELMRRRGCRRAALISVGAFAVFPITIRYGRAFQPDAAMLGAAVAGLACWDRFESGGRRIWLAAGWSLLALGIAIKISAAFLLIPLVFGVFRTRRIRMLLAAGATVVPAILWYAWAEYLLAGGGGSRASVDNRAIWLNLLGPSALAMRETWGLVFRFLVVRAFTPLGIVLAVWGLIGRVGGVFREEHPVDATRRLWWLWGVAASLTLAVLARKLHHEYYFLILAPVAAAGIGYAMNRLATASRACAIASALVLIGLCAFQVRSTWRLPDEWEGIAAASQSIAAETPAEAWVIAPEALLFEADRRGCRLEWTPSAARRAAGEWGAEREVRDPIDLVECYRCRGARYFADLGDRRADPRRMALHDAVRRRYKVIVDRPEVIIADLDVVETHPHAN